VAYRVAERTVSTIMYLRRDASRAFGVFNRWRVATELSVVRLTVPAGLTLTVNGEERPADGMPGVIRAFPGRYTFGAADNPLWGVGEATVDVEPGQTHAVTLQPQLKDSARSEIDTQVRRYLDDCAKQTVLEPPGCPLDAYSFSDVTGVVWKIERYPQYTVEVDRTGTLRVATSQYGRAVVTGLSPTGNTYRSSPSFSVSGTVTVAGGAIQFTPTRS
jgi:hypothetical protein